MVKYRFKSTPIKYGEAVSEKSRTLPNQAMSITELVKRFVRGIPVDTVQRDPVYSDQEQTDLEALSRLDNADRAFKAQEMRDTHERIQRSAQELAERRKEEADEKAAQEAAEKSSSGSDIVDNLDNTMSDDTSLSNKPLRQGGGKRK